MFGHLCTAIALGLCGLMLAVPAGHATPAPESLPSIPERMHCRAEQTAGFHDYPHNAEAYEAAVFFESEFSLVINKVFMQHLKTGADVYLTLTETTKFKDTPLNAELSCQWVRSANAARGLSCKNTPPAEFLLVNLNNWRFTRSSLGGWSFTDGTPQAAGDSIYVEYGHCRAD